MERLSALGGVEAVLPRGSGRSLDVTPVDRTGKDSVEQTEVDLMYIAPGFFEAVDAPVFLGRDFVATDSALELPPLILSDSLAQLLFPTGAIGNGHVAGRTDRGNGGHRCCARGLRRRLPHFPQ
jgi:hypothetical protein